MVDCCDIDGCQYYGDSISTICPDHMKQFIDQQAEIARLEAELAEARRRLDGRVEELKISLDKEIYLEASLDRANGLLREWYGTEAMAEYISADLIKRTAAHLTPAEEVINTAVMPRVDGKPFRCECLCNVFTELKSDTKEKKYVCNSCGAKYSGQPVEDR